MEYASTVKNNKFQGLDIELISDKLPIIWEEQLQIMSGQVWGHTPKQRVAAST